MPADPFLLSLITKARRYSGPAFGAAILVFTLGWVSRGMSAQTETLNQKIARLDSTTVKRQEFEQLRDRLQRVSDRGDSTYALLHRYVCRSQPQLCP